MAEKIVVDEFNVCQTLSMTLLDTDVILIVK